MIASVKLDGMSFRLSMIPFFEKVPLPSGKGNSTPIVGMVAGGQGPISQQDIPLGLVIDYKN